MITLRLSAFQHTGPDRSQAKRRLTISPHSRPAHARRQCGRKRILRHAASALTNPACTKPPTHRPPLHRRPLCSLPATSGTFLQQWYWGWDGPCPKGRLPACLTASLCQPASQPASQPARQPASQPASPPACLPAFLHACDSALPCASVSHVLAADLSRPTCLQ